MKIGDLFRNKRVISIHTDIEGCIGVILSKPNRHGQYKAMVKHKTLWILRENIEVIHEDR